MTTTERTNKTRLEQGFDALNEQDREAFVSLHTEDVVVHADDEAVRGIDDVANMEFAFFNAFPDLTLAIDAMVAEGDTVAARWTVTGTHEGPFKGLEPTGETVEFSNMGMFRFVDGQVAEVWLEGDRLGMLEQLGAVESPV